MAEWARNNHGVGRLPLETVKSNKDQSDADLFSFFLVCAIGLVLCVVCMFCMYVLLGV